MSKKKKKKIRFEENNNDFNNLDEIIIEEDIKEEEEKIDFIRALNKYKQVHPEANILMKDIDAIKIFTKKKLKELIATEDEFFEIFKKF